VDGLPLLGGSAVLALVAGGDAPDAELSYSIFYVRRKFRDKYSTENLQRARREGRLRVDGEGQLEIVVK